MPVSRRGPAACSRIRRSASAAPAGRSQRPKRARAQRHPRSPLAVRSGALAIHAASAFRIWSARRAPPGQPPGGPSITGDRQLAISNRQCNQSLNPEFAAHWPHRAVDVACRMRGLGMRDFGTRDSRIRGIQGLEGFKDEG